MVFPPFLILTVMYRPEDLEQRWTEKNDEVFESLRETVNGSAFHDPRLRRGRGIRIVFFHGVFLPQEQWMNFLAVALALTQAQALALAEALTVAQRRGLGEKQVPCCSGKDAGAREGRGGQGSP